jgi:hypothetical protein
MLRDSLGGSQDDDDDDDADFVSTAQIETFFTGSKALHVEAALTGRQVAHLLPIASHELLPGRLAVNTRYECTADVLATVAAHSEATQTPMVYVSRTIKQIKVVCKHTKCHRNKACLGQANCNFGLCFKSQISSKDSGLTYTGGNPAIVLCDPRISAANFSTTSE